MIQLVLLHLALVAASILFMGPLNYEVEAALSGSGETKPPLQAFGCLVLGVPQQARVIKLHYWGLRDQRAASSVEPSDFVEDRGTECTRDDVTLEFYLVSLFGNQLLLLFHI